jgi:hypothetical protein
LLSGECARPAQIDGQIPLHWRVTDNVRFWV